MSTRQAHGCITDDRARVTQEIVAAFSRRRQPRPRAALPRGTARGRFPATPSACDHSGVADSDARRHRRELRASYDDRERAVEFLKRNGAEGRLTTEELTERVGRALDAKTLGQLDDLVADLPPEPAPPPPVPLLPPRRNPVNRRVRFGLAALLFLALAAPAHHAGLLAVWIVLLLVATGVSRVQGRLRRQEQPQLGPGTGSGPWSSAIGWRPPRAGEKR